MTPQEAYTIVDRAVSQLNTNREGHQTLAQALNVLASAIQSREEPETA